MIKLVYAHLCDYTFTDPEGKVYILGIFDRIYSEKYPAKHPSMVVLSVWSGEQDESSEIQLIINDSDGEKIFETQPIEIVMDRPEQRLANRITNFVLPRKGGYTFQLYADEKLKGELTLTASIVKVDQEVDHAS